MHLETGHFEVQQLNIDGLNGIQMFKEFTQNLLSQTDFDRLSYFIHDYCGIKISPAKKSMVEARLRKRLKGLNFSSYNDYCEYLFSHEGKENELVHMVDVITTNKTDFFREPKQFSFMQETTLPGLLMENGIGRNRPLKVWSAGCSTGEEPYTISIVVNEFADRNQKYSYLVYATDVSTIVLDKAIKGIYEEDKISLLDEAIVKKYFLRSKDKDKKLVRIAPLIRSTTTFRRLNFMDNDFKIKDTFDVIFCRNVIIYFDKPTQDKLILKLLRYLNPGGYLFLGHSESIFNTELPVVQVAASTYRRLI
jgi:chemotaxis protein methyltransferase CheR